MRYVINILLIMQLIMELEKVQRDFTRLIDGLGLLTYEERLQKLQLTTLLERRMRGDIIETYKILSGKTNYGDTLYRVSRSGTKLLYTGKPGCYMDSFLPNRVLKYWNKLPDSVKQSATVDIFKSRLEAFKEKKKDETGNYWELSFELYDRLNQNSEARDSYVDYLKNNPDVAKRRGIAS